MEVIRIDVFQEGNATAIASVANPSKYQPVNIELPGTVSGEQSLIIRSVLENQSIVDAPSASVLLDQHVVMPIPEASSYLTAPGADYATVKFVLTYTYTGSLSNDIKLRIYKNDGTLLKDNIYGSKTSNNVFDFITNVNVTDQVTTVYAKAVDVYGDVSDASANVTITKRAPIYATIPSGSGTTEDPYRITNVTHLAFISASDEDIPAPNYATRMTKVYRVDENIDASVTSTWYNGKGFIPIGTSAVPFTGRFNGNNKTISNLCINRPTEDYVSFFSYYDSNSISYWINLYLKDVSITGKNNVAGFVSINNSCNIYGVKVSGNIIGVKTVAGLCAGASNRSGNRRFKYCGVNADISAVSGGYGFIPHTPIYVDDSYSIGTIKRLSGTSNSFYGFSQGSSARLTNCYAKQRIVDVNNNLITNITDSGFATSGNATACYFDSTYSGVLSSSKATALTSDKMTHLENYNGWSFKPYGSAGTWNIWNSRNSDYPYLDWEYPTDAGYSTCSNPAISPGGGISPNPFTVTLSCPASGASIYYTVDGTDPTTASTLYSAPFTVSTDTTVKATARKERHVKSEIVSAFFDITGTLSTPVINPAAGTYYVAQEITLSSTDEGVNIRYTTTGADVTESSSLYTSPFMVSSSSTVKAKAYKTGWNPSSQAASAFVITGTLTAPTFNPTSGSVGAVVTITYDPNSEVKQYSVDNKATWLNYTSPITIQSQCKVFAKSTATGWLPSTISESGEFVPSGTTPMPTFNPSPGTLYNADSIAITSSGAEHIYYTTNGTTPTSSSTEYTTPVTATNGMVLKALAANHLWYDSSIANSAGIAYVLQCATPTVDIQAGTYTEDKEVTVSCSTVGAIIRYTTNGNDPTQLSGTVISSGDKVTINSSCTLKILAYKTGFNDSAIASIAYVINYPQIAGLVFTPPAGELEEGTTITITTDTPDVTIKYTTDGSDPVNGTVYSTPVTVFDGTLRAIATKTGYISATGQAVYTIASTSVPFITEWVTSTDNEVITLPIYNTTGTYNYTVQWGDGQSNTYTTNGLRTHTYATAGVYQISISGSLPGWSFTSGTTGAGVSKTKITKIIQWGDIGLRYISSGFQGCSNLNEIRTAVTGCTAVTDFGAVFSRCSSLTTIPSDLFSGCTAVTNFQSAFESCKLLTTIPSGLFSGCTNVTNFSNAFSDCSSLTAIPSGLFTGCTAVIDFTSAFRSCRSLSSIPSDLFSGCTAVTNFSNAFYKCSSLTTIPSVLFSGCTDVTNFSDAFSNCSSLTAIPSGLFTGCTAVIDFTSAFRSCGSLSSIPSDLFSGCTAVTNFNGVFSNCTSLTTIPSDLFSGCTAVTNFSNAFYKCSSLTTIPSVLFSGCTAVTDFQSAFEDCILLTTIPSNLFTGCTAVINFSYTFGHCNKLRINPLVFGNCFDSNPRTVNVRRLFRRTSWTGSTAGTAPDLWNKTSITWTLGASTENPFYGAGNSATSITNYADIPSTWKS